MLFFAILIYFKYQPLFFEIGRALLNLQNSVEKS